MSLSFVKLAAVKAVNTPQGRTHCPLHVLLTPITLLFINPQKNPDTTSKQFRYIPVSLTN